ncbi:MAG TPA: hypothetical protein VFD92_25890 [Candidatus Binatia bacterium]|nr:hypothetical protein [Candidatus Binatia bacterium]
MAGSSPDDPIVVLGAGASVDAGIPSTEMLTPRLVERLRSEIDEFGDVYDRLAWLEPTVTTNFERLFFWMEEFRRTRNFRALLGWYDDRRLSTLYGEY